MSAITDAAVVGIGKPTAKGEMMMLEVKYENVIKCVQRLVDATGRR